MLHFLAVFTLKSSGGRRIWWLKRELSVLTSPAKT